MTKSETTKRLRAFEKVGMGLYTFNHNRAMPSGSKGWPDRVLIGRGWCFFIEEKYGTDKFSIHQEKFLILMDEVESMNPRVRYFTLTEKNVDQIISEISKCISKKK